jgi:hypothetical protein
VEVVIGEVEQRAAVLDAGVVHHDVDGPDLAFDVPGCGGDLRGVRHVEGAGVDGRIRRVRDFGSASFERCEVASVEHDYRTRLCEPGRERVADPSTGAGDECDLALDVEDPVRAHCR